MVLTTTYRGRCCAIRRPPIRPHSRVKSPSGDAVGFRHLRADAPIRQQKTLPQLWVKRSFVNGRTFGFSFAQLRRADLCCLIRKPAITQPHVVSFVYCLFSARGPAAVSGGVVPIYIHSLKRERVRVSIQNSPVTERNKAQKPLRAHTDATASVVHPCRTVWVRATVQHAAPDSEQACAGLPVFGATLRGQFAVEATTRFLTPVTQLLPDHYNFFAARTDAKPFRTPVFVTTSKGGHGEPFKGFAGYVIEGVEFAHAPIVDDKRKGGWA